MNGINFYFTVWIPLYCHIFHAEVPSNQMTTSKVLLLLILCCLERVSLLLATSDTTSLTYITRNHFSQILHTALDDQLDDNDEDRRLLLGTSSPVSMQQQTEDAWLQILQHGWTWSKHQHDSDKLNAQGGRRRRNLRSDDSAKDIHKSKKSPFVVCTSSDNESGFQRRQDIVSSLNIPLEHAQTVSNTMDESCFIVSSTAGDMEAYQTEIITAGEAYEPDVPKDPSSSGGKEKKAKSVKLGPLVDALKVPSGTIMGIFNDADWTPPKIESKDDLKKLKKHKRVNEFSYDNTTIVVEINVQKWSRSLMVQLIPGSSGDDNLDDVAIDIVDYVKDMAQISPRGADTALKNINNTIASTPVVDASVSIREAFSLTATAQEDDGKHSIWSTALKKGFEAPHGCQTMLDTIEVRTQSFDQFEVILYPPSQYMKQAAVESSAWNKHCALSLLIGLSVHPYVQSVEVSKPIILASIEGNTNPQWITQSGEYSSRPFFSNNLDGTGQIVGVADGGLDTNNCYLRDSSSSTNIYGRDANGWDFSQRKVVHYDDTFGDRTEERMGHGTYVSGIMSGRKSTNGINSMVGHADGTAPGSKLAFFDMEEASNGIADPGVDRLLKSLYNPAVESSSATKGARVINASWGRSYYGEYTSFCRQYDAALRNQYPDLLLVVSAGNTGREGMKSIQDPASCKNPFAVGSSLSYGTDALSGEKGINYLADYSSRGPTVDSRMKPDIVAPGHFVLATGAVPGAVGECDGISDPNVNDNNPGGSGVKYTTGTSMASPVLAGAAAILRQYFEEGYCNSNSCCGSKGCTASLNPSGSLLKAVLMNGAQPLTGGVQFVPSGELLDDQPLRPYDSNQGFGRVNLINSVPLDGENDMQMKVVNNKFIINGYKDTFTLSIDKSNCDRPLSVTLAWYDPAAVTGCTNCLVNDLDLFIWTSNGVKYPNGRSVKDSKNTVERIQINPADGDPVRIVVEAKNFATYGESYSLAVTGCFIVKGSSTTAPVQRALSENDTVTNHVDQQEFTEYSTSSIKKSSCLPFQLSLNTASNGDHLTWSLIKTLNDGADIEKIISGPSDSSGYENDREYNFSACLKPSSRYRFQLRNTSGENINGWYKLTYGEFMIFNSQQVPQDHWGRVSTFRFETDEFGAYQKMSSNAFTPRVETGKSAEVSIKG